MCESREKERMICVWRLKTGERYRVSCLKITQDEKSKEHGSELELELLGEAQIRKAYDAKLVLRHHFIDDDDDDVTIIMSLSRETSSETCFNVTVSAQLLGQRTGKGSDLGSS